MVGFAAVVDFGVDHAGVGEGLGGADAEAVQVMEQADFARREAHGAHLGDELRLCFVEALGQETPAKVVFRGFEQGDAGGAGAQQFIGRDQAAEAGADDADVLVGDRRRQVTDGLGGTAQELPIVVQQVDVGERAGALGFFETGVGGVHR